MPGTLVRMLLLIVALMLLDTLGKNGSNLSIVFPYPEFGIRGNKHCNAGTEGPPFVQIVVLFVDGCEVPTYLQNLLRLRNVERTSKECHQIVVLLAPSQMCAINHHAEDIAITVRVLVARLVEEVNYVFRKKRA